MRASRRKTTAMRSPSCSHHDETAAAAATRESTTTQYAIPPSTFSTPALQSLIYATSNDRYPGAPGTSLHRAKLEAARAAAATKRELQKEFERREEMKRLGILGVGKKRIVGGALNGTNGNQNGSTAASNGGNSRYSTPPATVERARRGQAAAAAAAPIPTPGATAAGTSSSNGLHHTSASSSTSNNSGRQPRVNGRSLANAIEHSSLPVPVVAAAVMPGSPLLTSSGRIRRPANSSRGASPMPLTANGNGALSSRVRSPIVAPMEMDDADLPERGHEGSVTAVHA